MNDAAPRCKQQITYDTWGRTHRCNFLSVKDGYCRMHHPDTVQARKDKKAREWEVKQRRREREWLALAIGHEVLKTLEAGGQMHVKSYEKITPAWALAKFCIQNVGKGK